MAANKKSFLFYVNWLQTFENLTDEEAGRLIKHLLRYVNDLNPEPPDRLTMLVFEPLKQILKVDLKKYENIIERNKTNGLKGGRPKKDINEDLIKTQSENIKPKKPSGLFGNPIKPKKADTDTDTDTELPKGNNIIDTNVSMSNEQAHSTHHDDIDYKKLVEYFNKKTNGIFGDIRYPISDKRRSSIRARIREHGKEAFLEMIEIASNSNFLKGQNKAGFRATFDWMIRPTNFQKIIEGNYNNSITHNDSMLTYDQVAIMVTKGELTFDMVTKIQSEGGKIYYKRK